MYIQILHKYVIHLSWHGRAVEHRHMPCRCCSSFFGGSIGECRHQLIESHQKGSDEETNIHSFMNHDPSVHPSINRPSPGRPFRSALAPCLPTENSSRKQTALIWRAIGLGGTPFSFLPPDRVDTSSARARVGVRSDPQLLSWRDIRHQSIRT